MTALVEQPQPHGARVLGDAPGLCQYQRVGSSQTLTEAERRVVAAWAADCAERVLPVFEAERPDDDRPREAIGRARAFSRGELDAAGEIRNRFVPCGRPPG